MATNKNILEKIESSFFDSADFPVLQPTEEQLLAERKRIRESNLVLNQNKNLAKREMSGLSKKSLSAKF